MKKLNALSAAALLLCFAAISANAQSSATTMKIKVFFAKDDPNTEIEVVAVEREIKKTKSVADAALRELFKGVAETETKMGLISTFEPKDIVNGRGECQGVQMKRLGAYFIGVKIRKGVAIVNFRPEAECYLQTAITAADFVMKPIDATLEQ